MAKNEARVAGGFGRHFEGWQPGLVAVFLAGTAALLAVPRSVPPDGLPLPLVEPQKLAETAANDDARARAVEAKPLDADVRALGSLLRAFGRADARGDDALLAELRRQIGPAAARALAQGDAAVLALRAYQLRAFLREVGSFVRTGETSDELVELGGPFADVLARNGWCEGGPPCVMHMDEQALRASFKLRWNEISGLSGSALALGVDERRALFAFLLAHPPRVSAGLEEGRAAQDPAAFLLRKIDELSALDPSYPREFARGVVRYHKGEFGRAAEHFAMHLELSPDGPYTLRAQNHLRAALERSLADSP
ncbi:hypothetical protein [Polyangium fumosum]|uniref:Tetratricopeptide repeat protein n=1 Tax=Polyangium fumosum TaxID=889272 RepID=A0A4U1J058_9BACT|nr:hypothetical protein [Polyangium fumosum]TKD00385.1 hypothetical protein E8A74_34375 [Polyangium fumosum]